MLFSSFKRTGRTSVRLLCHYCTGTIPSHACSMKVVAKTPTELLQENSGQSLLSPVRADQSEQGGLFERRALKSQTEARIEALQHRTV